jgi:hypothetical protein
MANTGTTAGHGKAGRKPLARPLLCLGAALALGLPSAGLAVVGLSDSAAEEAGAAFDLFTPASVDPKLAARVAEKARARGIRFTPVGTRIDQSERTVTVAVRVDDETAQAISIRSATESAPGTGTALARLQTSRFNLGTARGYQSFARTQEPARIASTTSPGRTTLPSVIRDLGMPDLAEFAPSQPTREDKPSRLQPRIELEDERVAGRSPNTLDSTAAQTVDLGGSFRLSPNLDVTAGVRYSQERERLDPLTNAQQDSQAVYVGTQIRF